MAKTTAPRRILFDRDLDFVAAKTFTFAGKEFRPGDQFDKSEVNTRRLRQMYDQRFLGVSEAPTSPPPPPPTRNPALRALSAAELRKWLADKGVVPRYGADRAKLLRMAESIGE